MARLRVGEKRRGIEVREELERHCIKPGGCTFPVAALNISF